MPKLLIKTTLALLITNVVIFASPILNIVTEELPPLSYFDKSDSKVKGIWTEVLYLAMEESGLEYKIRVLPWARALKTARENSNTIIYSIARTPDRENDFVWIKQVSSINYHLYSLKKNKAALESPNYNIKKLNVAVNKYDVGYKKLNEAGYKNAIFINDNEQMLNLLYRERVKLIVSNNTVVYAIIKDNPDYKDVVKLEIPLGEPIEFYFAINAATQKDVIDKINHGFKKIIENGKYDELMSPLVQFRVLANLKMDGGG